MNTGRTKLVVLALVVLLAFGAPTVGQSLSVLSDTETFDPAEIFGGTETGTSDADVQSADGVNETTTDGASREKTTGETTTSNEPSSITTNETTTNEGTAMERNRTTKTNATTDSESG